MSAGTASLARIMHDFSFISRIMNSTRLIESAGERPFSFLHYGHMLIVGMAADLSLYEWAFHLFHR